MLVCIFLPLNGIFFRGLVLLICFLYVSIVADELCYKLFMTPLQAFVLLLHGGELSLRLLNLCLLLIVLLTVRKSFLKLGLQRCILGFKFLNASSIPPLNDASHCIVRRASRGRGRGRRVVGAPPIPRSRHCDDLYPNARTVRQGGYTKRVSALAALDTRRWMMFGDAQLKLPGVGTSASICRGARPWGSLAPTQPRLA